MSDTPKTDALQEAFNNRDGMQVGDIIEAYEHARVLELENAALRLRALPAEMTPAIADVLELMVPFTGRIARGFREVNKVNIPRKIEKEHAYVIWWLLGHALKHGDDWRRHAADELPVEPNAKVVQS